MGLYAKYVFAPLMDWSLRRQDIEALRGRVVSQAAGDVLEIGFGTGLNLPHYTADVRRLTLLDSAELLPRRVARRVETCRAGSIERLITSAERLPLEDQSLDCVVSTWTLCSIRDVAPALDEIRRVLRPGGKLLLMEHGRSDDPNNARWQDRLNPLQRLVACGCNLNRPIDRLLENAGFGLERLSRERMENVPQVLAEIYVGAAAP
ncbi:MAG TPA: class I SAM-dependent methyltransferase [Pirellulaceae bacterium]|nr:class I SAM-dependent methyltransferase [Pirellulaceae bacterium]